MDEYQEERPGILNDILLTVSLYRLVSRIKTDTFFTLCPMKILNGTIKNKN